MILANTEVVFVHNPKTAGTSLLELLTRILKPPVHVAGVSEIGSYHPSMSMALGWACAVTGNRPEAFKAILCPIRNPYDREVSMYTYFRNHLCRSPTRERDLNDPLMNEIVLWAGRQEFGEYLFGLWRRFGTCDIWKSAAFYRMDRGADPDTIRLIRTEHVFDDLVAALRGVELVGELDTVPRSNVSDRKDTRSYYSRTSEMIVAKSYGWHFATGLYERNRDERGITIVPDT